MRNIRRIMLRRPESQQPHYGQHLGDAKYWGPYVLEALARSGLPGGEVEAPFVGSFPTFLVGDFVVKLFGPLFDGAASFQAERAMHELLASHPEIPAPAAVASGALVDDQWPFLITQRFRGTAVRDISPTAGVAEQLGRVLALLHQLPAPAEVDERDLLPALRASAPERLRRFGLPDHLVALVPDYLADAPEPTTLVHADVTEDHVFVRNGALEGVIDWGDAVVADPYYELVAVFFGALDGDRALWRAFLDGYGWVVEDTFPRRALQGVLSFQFNSVDGVRGLVDLDEITTLDELAEAVFS